MNNKKNFVILGSVSMVAIPAVAFTVVENSNSKNEKNVIKKATKVLVTR